MPENFLDKATKAVTKVESSQNDVYVADISIVAEKDIDNNILGYGVEITGFEDLTYGYGKYVIISSRSEYVEWFPYGTEDPGFVPHIRSGLRQSPFEKRSGGLKLGEVISLNKFYTPHELKVLVDSLQQILNSSRHLREVLRNYPEKSLEEY